MHIVAEACITMVQRAGSLDGTHSASDTLSTQRFLTINIAYCLTVVFL